MPIRGAPDYPDIFTNKRRKSARPTEADICRLLGIDNKHSKGLTDIFLTGRTDTDTYYQALLQVIADELFAMPKLQQGHHLSGQSNTCFIRHNENGLVSVMRRASDQKPMVKTLKEIFDGKLHSEDFSTTKEWNRYINRILPVLIAGARNVQKKRDSASDSTETNAGRSRGAGESGDTTAATPPVGAPGATLTENQKSFRASVMNDRVKIPASALDGELDDVEQRWNSDDGRLK